MDFATKKIQFHGKFHLLFHFSKLNVRIDLEFGGFFGFITNELFFNKRIDGKTFVIWRRGTFGPLPRSRSAFRTAIWGQPKRNRPQETIAMDGITYNLYIYKRERFREFILVHFPYRINLNYNGNLRNKVDFQYVLTFPWVKRGGKILWKSNFWVNISVLNVFLEGKQEFFYTM